MTAFPPVFSPISSKGLVESVGALANPTPPLESARAKLAGLYPGKNLWLTNSGTAALSLAITWSTTSTRLRVALPAYACPDMASAALTAGADIVLYDLDPRTLEPDGASFDNAMRLGCSHAVIAHLYGRVVDLAPWRVVTERTDTVLIEDAAQHAGARWHDRRAGGLAHWGILSFGRGKGINAGGGGALIVDDRALTDRARAGITAQLAGPASRGGASLLKAMATELLAHPALYGQVRNLKWLRVGDTRFVPLTHIASASAVTSALLNAALDAEPRELATRQQRAAWYRAQLADLPAVHFASLAADARDGALRYPARWTPKHGQVLTAEFLEAAGVSALGVVRSYPRTLTQYDEFRAAIVNGTHAFPGAKELAASVVTMPTHSRITDDVASRIVRRIRALLSD
jgi:dTDP-4-amino-4,6-dideoxygalactose transaminase